MYIVVHGHGHPFFRIIYIVVVAGRVILLIAVAANQPPGYYPGTGTNQGTFAATQQPTYYGPAAATNGGTFGLITPALWVVLGLSS